jgi:hypothetical protein
MHTACQTTHAISNIYKMLMHPLSKQKHTIHIRQLHRRINMIKDTENLFVYKITNWLGTKDVPPSDRFVHFLSTASHPRAKAMSPQEGQALLVVHSPHSTAPKPRFYSNNNSNPPTLFPLNLHNPRNVIPLLCHTVPHAFPLPSRTPAHCWLGNLIVEDSKNSQLL